MTSDLYSPALDVERADGEVDPDGVLLPLGELARLEALHQAGFSHVGVSDEDDLEEEVEGVLLRIHESVERSAGSHSSERERERESSQSSCRLVCLQSRCAPALTFLPNQVQQV